jgi:hypothetical protein
MAKTQEKKKTRRKETEKIVYDKLTGALAEFKNDLSGKKLTANLKKVSKLFAADLLKKAGKENGKDPKVSKKKTQVKKEAIESPEPNPAS